MVNLLVSAGVISELNQAEAENRFMKLCAYLKTADFLLSVMLMCALHKQSLIIRSFSSPAVALSSNVILTAAQNHWRTSRTLQKEQFTQSLNCSFSNPA